MGNIVVGHTYRVEHRRKGTFGMRITEIHGNWVHGTIVDGEPRLLSRHASQLGPGCEITVNTELATFIDTAQENPHESDSD